jgi:putative solute:sodium symporter small subunit
MAVSEMTESQPENTSEHARLYWRRTRSMTFWLMLLWFIVTFSAIFFARQLSVYTFLGWPISFFMAAQGSILIFVAIIAFYAWRMQRLDDVYNNDSEHEK